MMHSAILPGNGSVLLSKVYKADCKRHGAHCQHIHNFEGRKPHLNRQDTNECIHTFIFLH